MMKRKLFYTLIPMVAGLLLSALPMAAQNVKPFVIPELKQWTGSTGSFELTTATRIVFNQKQAGLDQVARQLSEDYQQMYGRSLTVTSEKAQKSGDIVLSIKKDKQLAKHDEGYQMTIDNNVAVTATTAKGAYWATRTILQMLEKSEGKNLPKGNITDFPDYSIRGFMLDGGRKFFPMSYLKDLVKMMAYYKMNTLQIHLNDNGAPVFYDYSFHRTYSAFRMECDTYPGLTAHDGYYRKDEFRQFQKDAAKLGVEIIPEFDAPAHSVAFTQYDSTLTSKEFGFDHLDLRNPKVTPFLDNLWKEYISGPDPVFVGKRVDIGTDEYSNKDSAVTEKFRALTDHMIHTVESYGKQAMLWGTLTHAKGKTPVKSKNVVMSLWLNEYADPMEMKKQGFQFVSIPDNTTYIVPGAGYYSDYLNIENLYNKWTPNIIGNETFDYNEPSLLGGMFAVWNDMVGNGISVQDIHHRIVPAMQTLSAKFWTGKDVTVPFKEFDEKRQTLSEAPGVNDLGRIGKPHSLVWQTAELKPNQKTPYKEVGYNYTIKFTWNVAEEKPGTALFTCPNSTFYLCDPVTGRLGYCRDGYHFMFNYAPYKVGEKLDIMIKGDNYKVLLFVNGQLKETKIGKSFYLKEIKLDAKTFETLVFPLQTAGNFNSQISNVEVYNYMLE